MSHPEHAGTPSDELPQTPDMPNFPILVVGDLDRSINWYVEALGFWVEKQLTGPDGRPAIVHLRRAQYRDILLTPERTPIEGRRGLGVRLSFTFFDETEDSIRALAEKARTVPGGSVEGPLRTPWNTVDLVSTDPDGYTVVISGVATTVRPDWQGVQEAARSGQQAQALA